MQELLQYLYQPSALIGLMLNVSVCAILLLVLIGFVSIKKKASTHFFFGWLVLLLISGSILTYSVSSMSKESNIDALKQAATISRQGNSLVITSKSHIVKNTTIEIEDESDKNVYIKIKDRLVKIAKSDL